MHWKKKTQKTIVAGGLLIALLALTVSVVSAAGFERWPVITLDGEDYYMAGAPDGPNGEIDVPGHCRAAIKSSKKWKG